MTSSFTFSDDNLGEKGLIIAPERRFGLQNRVRERLGPGMRMGDDR
jgi:hypothetical protein